MNSSASSTSVPTRTREPSFLCEVKAWLLDARPVQVARRHLSLVLVWISLGMLSALFIRLELLTPGLDTMQARTFGALLSLHGILMAYFVALPLFHGLVGHLMLARWMPEGRLAFPRLSVMAWHLLAAGGALVVGVFLVGGSDVGWSFDAAFGGRFTQRGAAPLALAVLMAAAALALMGINSLASLRVVRKAGMPAGGDRILAETLGCASVLALLVSAWLATAMVLVLADAGFQYALFAPEAGGNPQLFVLLFRCIQGPAQIMILLLALGTAASVIAERSRTATFCRGFYLVMVLMVAAAVGGWGAELWLAGSGQPVTLLGGQPTQVLVFGAFLASLIYILRYIRSGLVRIDTPLIYAFGFFITAVQGLGLMLLMASPGGAAQFGSTQLAHAQMHLMMMANLGMGLFGGLHACWERLTGRSYADGLGRILAVLVVVGTTLAFGPLVPLGLQGASYRANDYPAEFQILQVLATAGSAVLLVALLLAILNLVIGRKAAPAAARLAVLVAVLGLAGPGCGPRAAAQPETINLKISGMHCESCALNITRKLDQRGGVLACDVHFSNEVQTITFDRTRVGKDQLVAAITQAGFTVDVLPAAL